MITRIEHYQEQAMQKMENYGKINLVGTAIAMTNMEEYHYR